MSNTNLDCKEADFLLLRPRLLFLLLFWFSFEVFFTFCFGSGHVFFVLWFRLNFLLLICFGLRLFVSFATFLVVPCSFGHWSVTSALRNILIRRFVFSLLTPVLLCLFLGWFLGCKLSAKVVGFFSWTIAFSFFLFSKFCSGFGSLDEQYWPHASANSAKVVGVLMWVALLVVHGSDFEIAATGVLATDSPPLCKRALGLESGSNWRSRSYQNSDHSAFSMANKKAREQDQKCAR